MNWRIGVDSGGTFTDVFAFDESTGEQHIWKVSSTPDDPSRGILTGIEEMLAKIGAGAADVSYFGHGTTVGTNALIQHRGAKTGLITTDGFRDLLEIGRQTRPHLYDMDADKAPQLVPREFRHQVRERIRHDGAIEVPFDAEAFRVAARELRDAGVQAIAVSFLYGFIHTRHEEEAKAILLEECPDLFISVANDVAPEFREYERLSTAVVNAYLGPVMEKYIQRLAASLDGLGLKVTPHLTQSNGGVLSFDSAARFPARTVLSGPSTGVVGAQAIGAAAGFGNLITFDMGGTSSDVALMQDGKFAVAREVNVHGYPIKAPVIDIHTVGAGGGSIAHVDAGGLLKVGPNSAGAYPGPVCYDLGNDQPTVTDANVVLQTLNPTHLLAGRMAIRQDLARAAIGRLAEGLGLGLEETAHGILSVVTANMAKALRVISIQRGYDPREYALAAFGGAGPLHAARLAAELGISQVLIPLTPGTLCATGLLLTDLRADFARTQMLPLEHRSVAETAAAYDALVGEAERWFEEEKIDPAARQIVRTADIRYVGQNYELSVELPDGPVTAATFEALRSGFEAAHLRRYGFAPKGEAIQLVTFRVEAVGVTPKASFAAYDDAGADASGAIVGSRDVWMPEAKGWVTCPVYDRGALKAGNTFRGPAIVEQMDTTTVMLPAMTAKVDRFLNLVLEFDK